MEPGDGRSVVCQGGVIALGFRSRAIEARHAELRSSGGRWEFVTYRPHVSFTPDDGRALSGVTPFHGSLLFGPEVAS